MSKTNLRRITLVKGPIWRIHSLTLIISWFKPCLFSGTAIFRYLALTIQPNSLLNLVISLTHLHCNVIQRGCNAILGRDYKTFQNLPHMLTTSKLINNCRANSIY